MEVEFEHRRLKPGTVPPSLTAAQKRAGELGQKMSRRARVWRVVFLIAGAATIAFATQRAGMELQTGLCLFVVALPLLWVGGWLWGFLFSFIMHARKAKGGNLEARVGSTSWQQELESVTVIEKVKLVVQADGLHCVREGASPELVPWSRVKMDRVDAKTLALFVRDDVSGLALNETLPVPRSAFVSDEAFDAFCLEVQKHVWEAQR
ncbi:MAG: hypothetical protein QM817_02580 [Archangium sp.]